MSNYRVNLGKTGYLQYENIKSPTNFHGHRPDGGLWMSRDEAIDTWENWCINEGQTSWLSSEPADITIADDARVLILDSDEKVQDFINTYLDDSEYARIDYESVVTKYDVIEFRLDDWDHIPDVFSGLDVDSVLCLNPRVITRIHNPERYEPLVPGVVSDFAYSKRPADFVKEELSAEEFAQMEQIRQQNSPSEKDSDVKYRYNTIQELLNTARRSPEQATTIISNGIKEAGMVLVVPPEIDPIAKFPQTLLCCKLDDSNQPVLEGALPINIALWQALYPESELTPFKTAEKKKPDIVPLYQQAYIVNEDGVVQSQGLNITQIDQKDIQIQYDALTKQLAQVKESLAQNQDSWRNICAHVSLHHQTEDLSLMLQNGQLPVLDSNKPVLPLSNEFSSVISSAFQKEFNTISMFNQNVIQRNEYKNLITQNKYQLQCKYLSAIMSLPYEEANHIYASIVNQTIAAQNEVNMHTEGAIAHSSLEAAQENITRYVLDITSDYPFDSDKSVKGYVYEAYGKLLQDTLDDIAYWADEHAIEYPEHRYHDWTQLITILQNAPDGFNPADIMQKEGYLAANNISQHALSGKHDFSPETVKNIIMGTIADSQAYQNIKQYVPDILMQQPITKQAFTDICQNITNQSICKRLYNKIKEELTKQADWLEIEDAEVFINGTQITIEPKFQYSDNAYKIECNIQDDIRCHFSIYEQDPSTGKLEFVSLADPEKANEFAKHHDEANQVLKDIHNLCQYELTHLDVYIKRDTDLPVCIYDEPDNIQSNELTITELLKERFLNNASLAQNYNVTVDDADNGHAIIEPKKQFKDHTWQMELQVWNSENLNDPNNGRLAAQILIDDKPSQMGELADCDKIYSLAKDLHNALRGHETKVQVRDVEH